MRHPRHRRSATLLWSPGVVLLRRDECSHRRPLERYTPWFLDRWRLFRRPKLLRSERATMPNRLGLYGACLGQFQFSERLFGLSNRLDERLGILPWFVPDAAVR